MMDALANGRRIKCLTVVDDFTRECLDIAVDFGISGEYVVARAGAHRAVPRPAEGDSHRPGTGVHQPGAGSLGLQPGVDLKLIAAGKPTQNAYIESFNGKFRDECLNDHYFSNLAHARALIADWRRDYNEARPHSSLGRMPPAEFAARHRLRAGDGANQEIV